ncbi:MAG: hypothetical protein D6808_06340 [Candidatus Dadabacteria bacterium]|nr:MAG: hypothetical protein D6808_06340 [Candidatus Dadabacteria bacterium]
MLQLRAIADLFYGAGHLAHPKLPLQARSLRSIGRSGGLPRMKKVTKLHPDSKRKKYISRGQRSINRYKGKIALLILAPK